MEELILVTILPATVILTAFLFNIGTKEIIEFKYGLNTHYFKPIAAVIAITYFIILLLGLTAINTNVEMGSQNIVVLVFIILLAIIYLIMFFCFNEEKDKLFLGSDEYEPNEKKSKIFTSGGIIFPSILSAITSFILRNEIMEAINMLMNKNKNYFILIKLFMTLSICYILTIIVSGYIYNYGRIFNFKKYKLAFSKEFGEILDMLNIKYDHDRRIIDVYVLVETEESMTIKVFGIETPSIIIKKDHILNLLFVEEKQVEKLQNVEN